MRDWNRRPSATRAITRYPVGSSTGMTLERRLMPSVDLLTYHNDVARTGANLNETELTPANVNPAQFGKLAQAAVDGQVYAQPLVKTGVVFRDGSTHDVVFVATEHDSVYAFDANTLSPLWKDSFINPAAGITPASSASLAFTDLVPEVGITGTPVIDAATNTLFVVSEVQETMAGQLTYAHQLHALDLATGAERLGGPLIIEASAAGRGVGSVRGQVAFQSKWELQRSALLLDNGSVYVAFSSHGDLGPYHGWVLGYDSQTLRPTASYNITPNGQQGGIWMSGGGLASDTSGFIYLSSGNGTFHPRPRRGDYGDSIVKLAPSNLPERLAVVDYYTPSSQAYLNANDLDLGSGGVMLLPNQAGPFPHLLVTGAKEGRLYLINRDNLGRFVANPTRERSHQQIPGALHRIFSSPAYFNGTIYYVGFGNPGVSTPNQGDRLKAYSIVNGVINPAATSSPLAYGFPGAVPSVSANGATDGIVWTISNAGGGLGNVAELRAFDAANVTRVLYDSTQIGTRDQATTAVKFAAPTVTNGKVYVGSARALTMYGLFPRK